MGRTSDLKIINLLRQKIRSGGFDKTSFLPSERKLAEEYQVGRGIIRGALKVLSEEGIIYNVPRRGFRAKKRSGRRLKRLIVRLPAPVSSKAYEAMGLLAGLCSGANEIFAEVVLSTPPAKINLEELKERFNANEIQGIVFLESSPDIPEEEFAKAGIPCVIANMENDKCFPGVRVDFREIGRIAGRELIRCGYRKIGVYSGPTEKFLYREILAGFRGALAEEELTLQDNAHVISDWNGTAQEIRTLLSRPENERPDAIFTIRDYRAAHVFAVCQELSIRIPDDLAVISFDGISWPEAEKAGLCTITEDVAEIGRQTIFLLQQQFESGYHPEIWNVSGKLIPGTSLQKRTDD